MNVDSWIVRSFVLLLAVALLRGDVDNGAF
jgi:hypothetical protein